MKVNESTAVVILLVEDNPGDVRLTQESLKKVKIINELHVAKDGVEALDFLRRQGEFADAPRPHLILLDLNMPRMGGRELLEEIKDDADLKRIPVVVLTSSEMEEDIVKSYDLHANCYITKPVGIAGFTNVVQAIDSFWFNVVELPEA
ncbi:MAG: response regulator [Proteobacteria bacterium]|nr:response regulator [Pseudomonadota bacterium]